MERDRAAWLDGVRGLAALVVVFGHAANFGLTVIPGMEATAKAGVWLFFMLSAYLLVGRLLEDFEQRPKLVAVSRYAVRRVFRILPLYFAVLFALWLVNYDGTFDTVTTMRHALLIQAWDHFWTIPVEMSFYGILPLVVLTFVQTERKLLLAVVFAVAAIAVYVATPAPRIAGNPLALTHYLYFFALGFLVLFAPPIRRPEIAFAAFAIAAIATHPAAFGDAVIWLDLYPISATFMALAFWAVASSAKLRAMFSTPIIVFVGRISFSLYLTHYFILYELKGRGTIVGVLAVASSIVLAAALFYLIERPGMRLGARLSKAV